MRDLSAKRLRSAITNGTHLLANLDHRLPWARRLKDLIGDITSDLGGANNISEAERVLVRRAAMMTLQAELMEQRFSENENGAASSQQIECYGRTTNTLRRTLEALGLQRRARDVSDGVYDAGDDLVEDDDLRAYNAAAERHRLARESTP
jgi:hypothetical protein